MKASKLIKDIQELINIYGDAEAVTFEYVEENTPTEYHKYLKFNEIKLISIADDEKHKLLIVVQ